MTDQSSTQDELERLLRKLDQDQHSDNGPTVFEVSSTLQELIELLRGQPHD